MQLILELHSRAPSLQESTASKQANMGEKTQWQQKLEEKLFCENFLLHQKNS
jgi:hypothetical protein